MRISDWSSDVCSSDLLLLVIGAMSGLFGAQMAAAHSVPLAAGAPLPKGMDADCMAMMAKQQPAPSEKTCKGMKPGCIAAMGCVIPRVAAAPARSEERSGGQEGLRRSWILGATP